MSGAAKPEAPDVETCIVSPAEAGARLDRFLAGALARSDAALSRSRIKALLQGGMVSKDGATITDPSHRVKPGERYRIALPAPEEAVARPQHIALSVVYEDADLLVVDKPAGLTVHPGAGQPDSTLVNALLAHCGASLSGVGGVRRPGIVHRLDKDTSGLIVVAKNDDAHHSLAEQFASRTIDRAYLALVWGVPAPPAGRVEGNIGRHPQQRTKMTVVGAGRGKPAATRYRVLRRFGEVASLVECRLESGRTHQIRVHMAHIGHPVIGDPDYGQAFRTKANRLPEPLRTMAKDFPRQALHAKLLAFTHPVTGETMRFEASMPADMAALVAGMRNL